MPIPPRIDHPYDSLPSLIKGSFDAAVEAEQITIYEEVSSSTQHGVGAFSHVIFVCPELDEKPGAPHKTPDLASETEKDPFEGPSFEPGQAIADLGEHVLMTNQQAMRDEHSMIVSKGFRPQAGSLLEKDVTTAYEIVSAYKKQGRPLLGFFNGGPYAGASQPHLHIQFIPFVDRLPPGAEKLATASCDHLPTGQPTLLPTQHVHYALRLDPSPSSSVLYEAYQRLLSIFRDGIKALPASLQPSTEQKRDSYNLILTTDHMHLIPRSRDGCIVPHPRTRAKKGDDDTNEEMTFNGMTYAGVWFVGSEAERDDLVDFGLDEVLKRVGYERSPTWASVL